MEARSIVSTPQDQIKPSEADSNDSVLKGLRNRRDCRESAAAVPSASQEETPLAIRKRRSNATATVNSVKNLGDDSQPKRPKTSPAPNAPTSEVQQSESLASSAISIADVDPLIPYKDVTAAFAIDISFSTSYDDILTQEKKAVLHLSSHLSFGANVRARVLPWHAEAEPPIEVHKSHELYPGGGTDPTVLIADTDHYNLLRHCALWFLLTDGEIGSPDIHNFALGLSEKRLHGKACVVILFGTRPHGPVECNISVGQAVFAIAPDCAFLFHDVTTEEVYILQCKGCFRALLPSEQVDIFIDDHVRWKDIPRTTYDELAHIAVPQPREVDKNAIILESGRIVHLEHLYGDKLRPEIAAEILDSDDNLKSILLAAQNRGRSRDIEDWVSKQRVSRKATAYIDRPDLDGSALQQVKTLVTAMKGTVYHSESLPLLEALKQNLRDFHHRNWTAFTHSIGLSHNTADRRNTVVDDALTRVKLNRESPSSPVMMSPVSSGKRYSITTNPAQSCITTKDSPLIISPTSSIPPPLPRLQHVDLASESRSILYSPMRRSPYRPPVQTSYGAEHFLQSSFPNNPELSQVLYMKGYKLGSGPATAQPFLGPCSLCGDANSPLALLLKGRPADIETEGDFPTPNSHSDIKFPLAMGNYLETDIISSFLSCEKCAYFIRIIGTSPIDGSIKGAIPLVPLFNEMNRDSVLKEIEIALEHRFNTSILDQIFLSILYSKLDEVTDDDNGSKLLADALRWQCRNFMPQISLPVTLSSSFDPAEQPIYRPLSTTMSAILPSFDRSAPNWLVQYPVDGFVTLLKGSLDLGIVSVSDDVVKKAVFQRFLFNLVEQQAVLRDQEGDDPAAQELQRILQSSHYLGYEAVEGTYLLDEDTYKSFQRVKDVFECVMRDMGSAVDEFLRLMANTPWGDGGPVEVLEAVRTRPEGRGLFEKPWERSAMGMGKVGMNEKDNREVD